MLSETLLDIQKSSINYNLELNKFLKSTQTFFCQAENFSICLVCGYNQIFMEIFQEYGGF
jgi:hypothetical protein